MKRGKRIGYKRKTTTEKIVKMLKRKGIKAIHVSINNDDKITGIEMNSVILDDSNNLEKTIFNLK